MAAGAGVEAASGLVDPKPGSAIGSGRVSRISSIQARLVGCRSVRSVRRQLAPLVFFCGVRAERERDRCGGSAGGWLVAFGG